MAQTVVGIFDDASAAQGAVSRLTAYGFNESEIDVTSQGHIPGREESSAPADHSDDGFGERVSRFFKNLFDDDEDAERYSTLARSGTLVSVHAASRDEAERAAEILDEYGAIDVDERSNPDYQATSGSGINSSTVRDEDTNRSIPVIEEDMHVGKREVETGGMRLRSRIIERPVEESLRLRTEHLRVERTPADRPATEADLNTFREGEIEVRERAERPVINKQARVVEEIHVTKDVEEHDEVVRDAVRKTDVEIEQLDKESGLTGDKHKPGRKG